MARQVFVEEYGLSFLLTHFSIHLSSTTFSKVLSVLSIGRYEGVVVGLLWQNPNKLHSTEAPALRHTWSCKSVSSIFWNYRVFNLVMIYFWMLKLIIFQWRGRKRTCSATSKRFWKTNSRTNITLYNKLLQYLTKRKREVYKNET